MQVGGYSKINETMVFEINNDNDNEKTPPVPLSGKYPPAGGQGDLSNSSGHSVRQLANCSESNSNHIKVFTTRPDTIEGVTFLALSPEHPLVNLLQNSKQVENYIKDSKNKTDQERLINKEKTGVFTGWFAINPVTKEKIPIWIADYVLSTYATGAIMAVPYTDERDKQFAEKFGIKIKEHNVYTKQVGTKKTTYKLRDW